MSLSVIVAEDDPELLDAVANTIAATGARVTRCVSGAALLEWLSFTSFDLIVTDVYMPWMSGLQVATALRNAGIHTPIIVMTSLARLEVGHLGPRTSVLRKPFEMADLLEAVRDCLNHSGAAQPTRCASST